MVRKTKRAKKAKEKEESEEEQEMQRELEEIENEKEVEEIKIPRKERKQEEKEDEKEIKKLRKDIEKLKETVSAWTEFMGEYVTGGKPFFHQVKIEEVMLAQNTVKEWKGKQIRDIARDLASVQNKLHMKREFPAARKMHGLIEMVEVAKDITAINPSASPWMKKIVDEAIEVALREGTEQRGQAVFWSCMTKHLADHVDDGERQWKIQGNRSYGTNTSTATTQVECPNCVKNGTKGQYHTLGECAKRRNPCKMECRNCPQDNETQQFPCHWREQCPNAQARDRQPYQSLSYSRPAF